MSQERTIGWPDSCDITLQDETSEVTYGEITSGCRDAIDWAGLFTAFLRLLKKHQGSHHVPSLPPAPFGCEVKEVEVQVCPVVWKNPGVSRKKWREEAELTYNMDDFWRKLRGFWVTKKLMFVFHVWKAFFETSEVVIVESCGVAECNVQFYIDI